MINHELLRSFIAAADSGSFSAAGRLLGKHQATISGNIARLEDELNILLFDRVGKYPQLTEYGLALYDSAKVVVDSSERFNANALQLANGAPVAIRVGFDHHLDINDFVNVFQVLYKHYPLIKVSIINCSSSQLIEQTKAGSLDFALCPALEGHSQHYEFCNVGRWPIRFVCGKEHPLANKKQISNDELLAHTQIMALHDDHENIQYQGERMSPYTWECQDYNTSLSLIRANIGWGFLYSAQKPLSTDLVELFPEFALSHISIAYDIIWPKSQSLSTVSKLLIEAVRECFLQVKV
ncbi:transcriptional regulator [Vibrio inusitatus NBRC 102082]|uniref:Transcriptional regulator n=1 Tax=Vibrio inusitatus NBRC 102082 TaxID=1219070 RepID=A0A4Y3HUC2_9VIBR|nr:LysR family transcriptional regulator [Vibrio inusitatus]GEA49884.1 transcriptional regulator [Vibrio inusitatus NBRC 102082]